MFSWQPLIIASHSRWPKSWQSAGICRINSLFGHLATLQLGLGCIIFELTASIELRPQTTRRMRAINHSFAALPLWQKEQAKHNGKRQARQFNSIYPAASSESQVATVSMQLPWLDDVARLSGQPSCLADFLATFNKVFAIISARYQRLNIDSTANDRLNFAPMTMQQQRQIGDENRQQKVIEFNGPGGLVLLVPVPIIIKLV